MTIENLIECINADIIAARKIKNIDAKGYLVLQKMITENSPFKAYKECNYTLWLIKEEPIKVFNTVYTSNSSLESKEDIDKTMFKLFMSIFLPMLQESIYKNIIDGTYNEFTSK